MMVLAIVAGALAGCSTQKIAGSYALSDADRTWDAVLEIKGDGSFTQRLVSLDKQRSLVSEGTWKFEGRAIQFSPCFETTDRGGEWLREPRKEFLPLVAWTGDLLVVRSELAKEIYRKNKR